MSYMENLLFPVFSTLSHLQDYSGLFGGVGAILAQIHGLNMNADRRYKLSKINFCNYDLSKRWYLEFYVFSQKHGKVVRKMMRTPMKLKTKKERERWLDDTKRSIDKALQAGHILKETEQEKVYEPLLMSKAIAEALEEKQTGHRKRGAQTSATYHKRVVEFLDKTGKKNILLKNFSSQDAIDFMRWISLIPTIKSNRTYNNFLAYMRAMFATFLEREYVVKNPFVTIKKKKTEEALNTPFNKVQKKSILKECSGTQLELFVKFAYYTCARPTELRQLRVEHLLKDRIMIPGTIAKNGNNAHILIFPGLEKEIVKWKLRSYPPEMYIFGKKEKPGDYMLGVNAMYNAHRMILDAIGIKKLTLYTWKDTGACDLYLATKDIEFVSRHLRHHSLDMTRIYLRSMGVLSDASNMLNAPVL